MNGDLMEKIWGVAFALVMCAVIYGFAKGKD